MVKAAVLTGDGRYKYAGYDTADLDSAWLLGSAGIAGYRAMEGRKRRAGPWKQRMPGIFFSEAAGRRTAILPT